MREYIFSHSPLHTYHTITPLHFSLSTPYFPLHFLLLQLSPDPRTQPLLAPLIPLHIQVLCALPQGAHYPSPALVWRRRRQFSVQGWKCHAVLRAAQRRQHPAPVRRLYRPVAPVLRTGVRGLRHRLLLLAHRLVLLAPLVLQLILYCMHLNMALTIEYIYLGLDIY